MRLASIWLREFLKLVGGWRRHPVTTQCPICQQTVRLHVNKAGRRHVFAHAQALYEGARLGSHRVAAMECIGSGTTKVFDPHPREPQRFKLPEVLRDE